MCIHRDPCTHVWYTAAVVHDTRIVNSPTFKAYSATHAEEIAIALALTYSSSKHIITDSRAAYRNCELGWPPPLAQHILQPSFRYLRVIAFGPPVPKGSRDSLTVQAYSQSDNLGVSFKDIAGYYKEKHRRYTDPVPGGAKHFNSSFDGACQLCGERADTFHIVWAWQ